eukprot:6214687-Pleurochrysis_carterae.AAC.3
MPSQDPSTCLPAHIHQLWLAKRVSVREGSLACRALHDSLHSSSVQCGQLPVPRHARAHGCSAAALVDEAEGS